MARTPKHEYTVDIYGNFQGPRPQDAQARMCQVAATLVAGIRHHGFQDALSITIDPPNGAGTVEVIVDDQSNELTVRLSELPEAPPKAEARGK